jgi:hypothetical protein
MGDIESQGLGRDIRGLLGRWPDADGILQGGLSEGLRDWDLWYVEECAKIYTLLTRIEGARLSSAYCSVSFCRCEQAKTKRTWCSRASSHWYGLVRPL